MARISPSAGLGRVAQELGGADRLLQVEPQRLGRGLAGAGPGGAGAPLLLGHRRLEAGHVHRPALGAQRVLREVEREAVGVVQAEGDLARQRGAVAELRRLLRQQAEAAFEQVRKRVSSRRSVSVTSASARRISG
jgi:hypothetical protein